MDGEYNPWIGARMSIAWQTAIDCLIDGDWWDAYRIIQMMCRRADIVPKTATNILWQAANAGALQKRGQYVPMNKRQLRKNSRTRDGREFRLHPEGLPDPWHPDCKDE
jgi:hypothetical protein